MPHFTNSSGLDLANPFPRALHNRSSSVQGVFAFAIQSKSQTEGLFFPWWQAFKGRSNKPFNIFGAPPRFEIRRSFQLHSFTAAETHENATVHVPNQLPTKVHRRDIEPMFLTFLRQIVKAEVSPEA